MTDLFEYAAQQREKAHHTATAEPSSYELRRQAFERFHAENPHIYDLFCRFADELIQRGRQHYSARLICSRIVWHIDTTTTGDGFKINDHHSPFYARLWLEEHPEHEGFFRTRGRSAS